MPDREKYIEVLSKTAKKVKEFNEYTPIKISLECVEDILELLKEQETQKFFVDESGKITPLPVVVRCKDCKHRPKKPDWETYEDGGDIEFPDEKCPCQCSSDRYYSWYPDDEWFCAEGERK